MTSNLKWIEDLRPYERSVRTGSGQLAKIEDAYAQWNLTPQGFDFALSNELPIAHENDFRYVEAFTSLDGDGDLQTQSPLLAFDFAKGDFRPQSDVPTSNLTVFAPLPVRTSSVLPPDQPAQRAVISVGDYDACTPEDLVIVGIIDDSINIAHERFQTKDGQSRVDFAWVQDADLRCDGSTVRYGYENTRQEIEAAIGTYGDDQDGLLRRLRLVGNAGDPYRPSPLQLRASHGTHVADLAAGYDPDLDQVNRRIITVQLPALVTQDTSGGSLVAAMRSGLQYIFARALTMSEALRVPIPVVLCTSYSLNGGDRSGRNLMERIMRRMALNYRLATKHLASGASVYGAPVQLVAPAGNAHLSRSHAVSTTTEDGSPKFEVTLRVQPADRTSTFVEIWLSARVKDAKVRITAPGQAVHKWQAKTKSGGLSKAQLLVDETSNANVRCRVSIDVPFAQIPPFAEKYPSRILIALAPTQVLDGPRPPAPHGSWKIEVETDVDQDRVFAWIQRDANLPGFGRRSRQAYFEDAVYEANRFDSAGRPIIDDFGIDSPVRRNGSVSSLTTSDRSNDRPSGGTPLIDTISVGASRWDNGAGALYSGAGRPADNIAAPYVVVPSETSAVLPNILAAGSRNGTRVAQTGTSFSAPQVARSLADGLSQTAMESRENFDGKAFLKAIATDVAGPDAAEIAHIPPIRAERLSPDGGDGHAVVAVRAGLQRGGIRKV